MLRPLAIQAALDGLLASRTSPADVALVVLSDSGSMYAQAHLLDQSTAAGPSSSTTARRTEHTDIDGLQRTHQPGLSSLMPIHTNSTLVDTTAAPNASSASPMLISLTPDERARVLAGSACQAWTEEVARVRRLRTSATGRFPAMASSTGPSLTSGGSSGAAAGIRQSALPPFTKVHHQPGEDGSAAAGSASPALGSGGGEENEQPETSAVPVAILGTPLPNNTTDGSGPDVAPLLLESELGATLVLPLLPQGAHLTYGHENGSGNGTNASSAHTSHAALLLVLSVAVPAAPVSTTTHVDALGRGNSSLTQAEWNALHDAAQCFAAFVAPALRKAFGRSGELLPDDHPGGGAVAIGGSGRHGAVGGNGGATTIFSDDRESTVSVEASQMLGQAAPSASQISVP